MRTTRRKATALLAVLQLTAAAAWAQSPGVERLFPAKPTGYVNDLASVIDPAARTELEDLITRLRSATGAEIAVVTLPTIGDYDEADVALAIGRKWGVGARADIGDQRRNAGIVLLLVPRINHQPGTGHVRIEVGQGLEGIVTDAASGEIRRDVMGPLLAQEQYGAALTGGVKALTGRDSARLRRHRLDPRVRAGAARPGRGPTSLLSSCCPSCSSLCSCILANRGGRRRGVYWGGGPWIGGGVRRWWLWRRVRGGGGGGFGGFGGGGGFSGGGSGGRF